MEKYICVSEAHQRPNFNNTEMFQIEKRALFYRPTMKGRVYRRTATVPKGWRLYEFETIEEAQALCDQVNKSYNDDFKPQLKKQ